MFVAPFDIGLQCAEHSRPLGSRHVRGEHRGQTHFPLINAWIDMRGKRVQVRVQRRHVSIRQLVAWHDRRQRRPGRIGPTAQGGSQAPQRIGRAHTGLMQTGRIPVGLDLAVHRREQPLAIQLARRIQQWCVDRRRVIATLA